MPGVRKQFRQGLGPGDDREEVGVAAPPRHHVLVQVGSDPRAGHRALLIPRLKPCGWATAASTPIAVRVSRAISTSSSSSSSG